MDAPEHIVVWDDFHKFISALYYFKVQWFYSRLFCIYIELHHQGEGLSGEKSFNNAHNSMFICFDKLGWINWSLDELLEMIWWQIVENWATFMPYYIYTHFFWYDHTISCLNTFTSFGKETMITIYFPNYQVLLLRFLEIVVWCSAKT
jgi:hypothetical protein